MAARHRWLVRLLLLPLALSLSLVTMRGDLAAAGDVVVPLNAGLNQVVYRGPSAPGQLIADQLPGLISLYRWDAELQRHELIESGQGFGVADWAVEPGDVLWLRMAQAHDWVMPVAGPPGRYAFHSGWNVYGWPSGSEAGLVDSLHDRLHGLWVKDSDSGRFAVYSPQEPASRPALDLITPFNPVWVLLSEGPALDVGLGDGLAADLVPSAGSEGPAPASDATQVERAIVRVQSQSLAGSGFVVGDRLVLTSAHLLGVGDQVAVRFYDDARAGGRVAAIDASLDLAVIRVETMPDGVRRLDWESAERPGLTTPIWAWGFPLEGNLTQSGFSASVSVSGGFVSAVREREGVRFLQTDAAMNPGNSGGAITLQDGRLVGVASATFAVSGEDAEGIAFAVDIAFHRDALRDLIAGA